MYAFLLSVLPHFSPLASKARADRALAAFPAFLLLLIPSGFVAGELRTYGRGRTDADGRRPRGRSVGRSVGGIIIAGSKQASYP